MPMTSSGVLVGAVVGRTWATARAPASFHVGSHKMRSDRERSARSDQSSTMAVRCSKSVDDRSVRSLTKRAGIGTENKVAWSDERFG